MLFLVDLLKFITMTPLTFDTEIKYPKILNLSFSKQTLVDVIKHLSVSYYLW